MLNYHLARLVRRLAWLLVLAGACAAAAGAAAEWGPRDATTLRSAAQWGGAATALAALVVGRKAGEAERKILVELRRKSLRHRVAPRRGFEVVMTGPPPAARGVLAPGQVSTRDGTAG